ncbi:MAG: hypothetical protein J6U18_04925, partial [Acetobacter sp.]|nr:hypothetical protein [Acetobacter sp.]
MPSNLIQYKVFLAWTSNLQEEKEKFEDVLNSFSREREEEYYQSFRAVHSSQIPSGFGRPQDTINEKIKDCDYAVFVLYDNLGSDAGGESEKTGIEEEWDLVTDLKQKGEILDIALFFKKVDDKRKQDPGNKLKKLLEFKNKITAEVFYKEYETLEGFSKELESCLRKWGSTPFIQNNKNENSFQSSSEFSTSPKESESDNGKEHPSFHYWMRKVNQLLECGVKKQNSTLYLFPEEYRNALFCAKEALETAGSKVEKAQALNRVGPTKFYLRDYQGVIGCCEEIIKEFGGESELSLKEQVAGALYNKGVALGQLKHEVEAIGVYDEVIRRFSGE